MLPDFPVLKKRVTQLLDLRGRSLIDGDSLIGRANHLIQHEGHDWSMRTFDGYEDNAGFEEIRSELTIKREDIVARGPAVFFEHIDRIAAEIIGQQHRMLFRKLDTITERTGKVISGEGRSLDFPLLLASYKTMDMDFDEGGRPIMPTLVMHPDQWEKIKDRLAEWETNPEYSRQLDDVIEEKRRAWLDRESRRTLVD